MKVLVIPDVHLRWYMFDEAAEIYKKMAAQELLTEKQERQSVGVVCLMDLPDDWGKEDDLASYEKTFDRAIQFVREFREENIYFCYGNHDISYVWGKEESGYSTKAEELVRNKMVELRQAFSNPERLAFLHCIDRTLFSHAGISAYYAMKYVGNSGSIEQLIYRINHEFSETELWMDDSPIWVRMQGGYIWPVKSSYLQVVGHTPVKAPLYDAENELLSLDTFSTDPDGVPIGDCRYVVVDTVQKTFEYADRIVDL